MKKILKSIWALIGGALCLGYLASYFYMWDNLAEYKFIIMIIDLIGHLIFGIFILIYLVDKDKLQRKIRDGVSQ